MRARLRKFLPAVLVCILAGYFAMADPILVNPTDYVGSRNTGANGGLVGTEQWDGGDFLLSWEITDNLNGTFTYEYTISGDGETHKELSHWILELSNGPDWDGVFDNVGGKTEVKTFGPGGSNPGIPGNVYGVKFDFRGLNIAFTTEQAPVWGDFYAKDGKNQGRSVHAYNVGFSDTPKSPADFINFIARPDGASTSVPEPAALLLLGSGLLVSGFLRRCR